MSNANCRAQIIERKIETPPMNIAFPEVVEFPDKVVQEKLNEIIEQTVAKMIDMQVQLQGGPQEVLDTMLGTYEVTVNKNCILSIKLENFAFFRMHANGLTIQKGLSFNLKTGQVYDLKELFLSDSQYRVRINRIIEQQIQQRDIPLLGSFPGITDFQEFYLTETDLVIFFQEIEITPHFVGIPEFPIPLTYFSDMVPENSPIALLLNPSRGKV